MAPRPVSGGRDVASDGAQIANWFSNVPTCTRFLLASTSAVSVAAGLHLVSPYYFAFIWTGIWTKFQIWRLLTSVLLFPLDLHGLLCVIMLYQYSNELERQEFVGRTADYAWFLIFCTSIMFPGHWLSGSIFFAQGLLMLVTTLWALNRPSTIVKFMFAFQFPARYLPYVLMGIEYLFVLHSFPYSMAYGWGAAQLYYYIAVDLPARGGINYIPTPQLVYRVLGQVRRPNARTRYGSTGVATTSNPIHQTPGGGHFWGAGRRLG
ncbi:hypothetical protein IW140_005194 [Coemansia sp. RSA 1813]|nr:hypothetical protein EV178_002436 [Coemansia sp. RSA 1646]KAJ1767008.1 hypothetical protein LPJ74_005590 [Coemansia sp. RSA 1843]KAJ2093634.1 hypothetical protein IW138_000028 [Coemansia sp. RSA 986]KAJ2214980.1 hypothetical protein EV179_002510 [Coemansia sp. RSA 487]KAJ2565730.1 hypothetical protein IW140_005194 [Coemansia sp. RSA 1813]